VLVAAGLSLPEDVRTDGTARVGRDGRLRARSRDAVYFAWEDYIAVRTPTYLLRESPGTLAASRCRGEPALYETAGTRATPIAQPARDAVERLRRRVATRLEARDRRFRRHRYDAPHTSFSYGPDFWSVQPDAAVRCRPVSADSDRAALGDAGWLWTGRGLALLDDGDAPSVTIAVDAPVGDYTADVGVVPIGKIPWLWGFDRWLRSFRARPADWVGVGPARADEGVVKVALAPELVKGTHVVALRLTPPNAVAPGKAPAPDAAQQERLRALGYVE
jgi:hypothetical protein